MRSDRFVPRCFNEVTFINGKNTVVWVTTVLWKQFVVCNHATGIISLLVASDLTIWCKCSLFTRTLDNSTIYLRPINVPNLTELTTSYSDSIFRACWIEWNIILFSFKNQVADSFGQKNYTGTYRASIVSLFEVQFQC